MRCSVEQLHRKSPTNHKALILPLSIFLFINFFLLNLMIMKTFLLPIKVNLFLFGQADFFSSSTTKMITTRIRTSFLVFILYWWERHIRNISDDNFVFFYEATFQRHNFRWRRFQENFYVWISKKFSASTIFIKFSLSFSISSFLIINKFEKKPLFKNERRKK